MNRKLLKKFHFILLVVACGFVASCSSHSARLEQVPWDDMTSVVATNFHPNPQKFSQTSQIEQSDLLRLSPTLQRNPRLAQLAVSRAIDGPILYEDGVFGAVGNAKMFIADRKLVPDFDRLYWVMVKVLSRKYGCFMMSRVTKGEALTIKCRDKRSVVLWRSMGKDWIQFYARQFDRHGFEIRVQNKRIIRVSKKPVLDILL